MRVEGEAMEYIQPILAWCADHWSDVLAVLGAAVAAASIIVKATPSQADDAILGKVVKVLDWLSVFNPRGTRAVVDKDSDTPIEKKPGA